MGVGRVSSVFTFVAFVCVWAASSSEGNRKLPDNPWGVQQIDEDTAEQIWIHCIEGLHKNTKTASFLDFSLYQAATGTYIYLKSDITLLRKRILQKAIGDLPPDAKQILLECLKRISPPLHGSGRDEAASIAWFIKYEKVFSQWSSSVPRRHLRERKLQDKLTHDVAAPILAPSPGHGVVSPIYAPVPSFEVPTEPPAEAPTPETHVNPPAKPPTTGTHVPPPAKDPTPQTRVNPSAKTPTPPTPVNPSKPWPVIPPPAVLVALAVTPWN